MKRRNANKWWGALGFGLALELAWCGFSGINLWSQHSDVAISSRELDVGTNRVGYTVGLKIVRGAMQGAEPVQFLVIEGPADPAKEHYRGGGRVIFDADRISRMWLPVTRTKLIDVNVSPPQSYYVLGEQVERGVLPMNFTRAAFEKFLKSPEAKRGAPGLKKWFESQ